MIRETLCRTEIVYSAGKDISQAADNLASGPLMGGFDKPQEAWDALPYEVREYAADDYEVYEFRTETTVVKVEPPYTAR